MQGLEHGRGSHVCHPQVSSCVAIDSPSFLGVRLLKSLLIVLVSGPWIISCLAVLSLELVSWFLVFFSLGVSVASVLRFFSSPPSAVTSGSFVFFSGIFGRSRVFILSSSCPRVPQLHQVTSRSIALGRGRPPAGHLQLVFLGPASVSIDAFQLLHVHLLGRVWPSTW